MYREVQLLQLIVTFQYAIYNDPETNTTNIVFNTNIVENDIVRCFVVSRNPIATSCGVIRSFGNFLVAGNLKETTTSWCYT